MIVVPVVPSFPALHGPEVTLVAQVGDVLPALERFLPVARPPRRPRPSSCAIFPLCLGRQDEPEPEQRLLAVKVAHLLHRMRWRVRFAFMLPLARVHAHQPLPLPLCHLVLREEE